MSRGIADSRIIPATLQPGASTQFPSLAAIYEAIPCETQPHAPASVKFCKRMQAVSLESNKLHLSTRTSVLVYVAVVIPFRRATQKWSPSMLPKSYEIESKVIGGSLMETEQGGRSKKGKKSKHYRGMQYQRASSPQWPWQAHCVKKQLLNNASLSEHALSIHV